MSGCRVLSEPLAHNFEIGPGSYVDADRELKGVHRRRDVVHSLGNDLVQEFRRGYHSKSQRTYEAQSGEVDGVQTSDLGVEGTRSGGERLDCSDHLVRGLSHGPNDTQEDKKDSGEECVEELHCSKEGQCAELEAGSATMFSEVEDECRWGWVFTLECGEFPPSL